MNTQLIECHRHLLKRKLAPPPRCCYLPPAVYGAPGSSQGGGGPGSGGSKPGPTTVCVTNLPNTADELLVIKRFSPYGAIVNSTIVASGPTSLAFVTYGDAKGAWAAVEGMSGQVIGVNRISCSVQIAVIS
jgi:hypothetical protein